MKEYVIHRTKDGERWDALAFQYYNDVVQQRVLIAANRDQFPGLSVPAVLPAGLTLRMPLIEAGSVITDRQLPPWKRGYA